MKIAYVEQPFGPAALRTIEHAETICQDYSRQGYSLTLRQLYYRFVATDAFPDERRWRFVSDTGKWVRDPDGTKNAEPNYKWLGGLVSDARVAGLIDWSHITDRTRHTSGGDGGWDSPADMVQSAADDYSISKWDGQPEYIEVWVEKEALAEVISRPAARWNVTYLACKGYVSQSEMHAAARRLARQERDGRATTIIHLGDHDPSGIDMTRDIEDRLAMFGSSVTVDRIALNMPQIEELNPPPSPAKITDSRAAVYIERFGDDSWELDAIEPAALDALVGDAILQHLDQDLWTERVTQEDRERRILTGLSDNWEQIAAYIEDTGLLPPA